MSIDFARRVRAAGAVVLALAALAACDKPSVPTSDPEPDLATVRSFAWTNTAQELAGVKATSDDTKARIYGFADSGFEGPRSTVVGDLVLSGVATDKLMIVAAQDAKTGEVRWRRSLPIPANGYVGCSDDEQGPYFGCIVHTEKTAKLWVMSDRTGAVRTKVDVDARASFALADNELYLVTFTPTRKDTRLDVHVERRSWNGKRTVWTRNTSFAIDGWGHDGAQGFDIGRDRVVAFSASWQVALDRSTGRLLDRVDQGRSEVQLSNGGRLVVDSGDGTSERVSATLFAADGRPIADVTEAMYPEPTEVDPHRLIVWRHLLSLATGRTVFTAPRNSHIIAVLDEGRVAVTEPDAFEFAANRIPIEIHDVATGKRLGRLALVGNWSGRSVAGGHGVVKLVQHYDDKTDTNLPPTLAVIDARKPAVVATIKLGPATDDPFGGPTLERTGQGVVVTSQSAVRGLVAR